MTIAADIGRATFAGFDARDASARVKVNGDGLQIDRLAVADLGGGGFSASGRIDTGGHAPRGSLALDFESRQTAAIAALVDKFAPGGAAGRGLLDARRPCQAARHARHRRRQAGSARPSRNSRSPATSTR